MNKKVVRRRKLETKKSIKKDVGPIPTDTTVITTQFQAILRLTREGEMNKNKLSAKQNTDREKRRWLHFYDTIVLDDLSLQFQAIILDGLGAKFNQTKIWSWYLIQDFVTWKRAINGDV